MNAFQRLIQQRTPSELDYILRNWIVLLYRSMRISVRNFIIIYMT